MADNIVGADRFCNLSAEYEHLHPDFMLWSKDNNPLHVQKREGLKVRVKLQFGLIRELSCVIE